MSEGPYVKDRIRRAITKAQANGTDAVFHGTCRECLHMAGNSSGEGMRYCMGCATANWSEDGESLFVRKLEQS